MLKTIINSTIRYATYKTLDATVGHIFNSAKIDGRRKYTAEQYQKIVAEDVKENYGIDLLIQYITNDDYNAFLKIINDIEEDCVALENSIKFFCEYKKIREFKSDIKRHNANFNAALELWNVYKSKLKNTEVDGNIVKNNKEAE